MRMIMTIPPLEPMTVINKVAFPIGIVALVGIVTLFEVVWVVVTEVVPWKTVSMTVSEAMFPLVSVTTNV